MNAPIVITPVSITEIEKLITNLRANKITVTVSTTQSYSYEINGGKIEATAVYVLLTSTLTITINHKPFYYPMSMIERRLRSYITQE